MKAQRADGLLGLTVEHRFDWRLNGLSNDLPCADQRAYVCER